MLFNEWMCMREQNSWWFSFVLPKFKIQLCILGCQMYIDKRFIFSHFKKRVLPNPYIKHTNFRKILSSTKNITVLRNLFFNELQQKKILWLRKRHHRWNQSGTGIDKNIKWTDMCKVCLIPQPTHSIFNYFRKTEN